MNPHNYLKAIDPPGTDNRRWECQYCHQVAPFEELRKIECTYVYPPCKHCGQTPECAADCPGIMGILKSPAVHLATDDRALRRRVEREKKRRGIA